MLKFILNLFGVNQISYFKKKSSQKLAIFTKTIDELDQLDNDLKLLLQKNQETIDKISNENNEITNEQCKVININSKLKNIFQ